MTEDGGRISKAHTQPGVVGPLSFCNQNSSLPIHEQLFPSSTQVICLFCDKTFQFYQEKHEYLAHLYLKHRLIIGDEDQVSVFHEYLTYWHDIFAGDDFTKFCTTMMMDQLPDGTPSKNEQYFLLCDVTPQDFEIRKKLQTKRLELALAQHQFERTDDKLERNCLFCRDVLKTTRYHFIEHLYRKHFLQLGKPDNLVFIDTLIDTVQLKLSNLICLFCEKKFKDRPTLKEHMRKKGHKRINPENKNYDRFFLINYQNQYSSGPARNKYSSIKYKNNDENNANIFEDDSNWSDWEDDDGIEVTCLYCSEKNKDFSKLKNHIEIDHGIDFDKETNEMTFYDRVKIVNYVRRKIFKMECLKCDKDFRVLSDLQKHLEDTNHYSLGNRNDWDFPQYFFPMYEDDGFLYHLDDTILESGDNCDLNTDNVVICEDRIMNINLDAETLSKELLKLEK